MPAISTSDLTKQFDEHIAVDRLNLTIEKGEIFGLLGPNGAGKTTTLMMLSTLLQPTSGTATVNGFDVRQQPSLVRNSIGMVFQDPSSDDVLTGYENLKLHALMYDVPMKEIDARIDSVLALVELQSRKNDVVKKYSGGMRRRMEIARGLLHKPAVLFLDEPTLGLDPQTREHIWEYVESLRRNFGATIIVTTHYMDEADSLCDRVAIIDHGKIVALDTPENLRHSIGGDAVTLQGATLRVDDIRRLPFVTRVEERGGRLILSVENARANLPEILRTAGDVAFVESHAPDLNDVFLFYTGSAIRDESGDAMNHLRDLSKINQK